MNSTIRRITRNQDGVVIDQAAGACTIEDFGEEYPGPLEGECVRVQAGDWEVRAGDEVILRSHRRTIVAAGPASDGRGVEVRLKPLGDGA